MIYLSFCFWLLLIVFTGIGVYRLLTGMVKPAVINWALLPGTAVSELAYIVGCLVTGGEVRRAKLMETSGAEGGGEPTTESSGGVKGISPMVASLLALTACGAGILAAHRWLGAAVLDQFALGQQMLPVDLPGDWRGFWTMIADQIHMLRRFVETLGDLKWLDWRVSLFVYLSACLSVRLVPGRRDLRSALAAVAVAAGVIALIAVASQRFRNLMQDLWPLVSYVWANLLVLLAATLLVRGIVGFVNVLRGKS